MTTEGPEGAVGKPKAGFDNSDSALAEAVRIRAERIARKSESTRDLGTLAGTGVDMGHIRKLAEELEDLIARKELADEELRAIERRADELRPYINQLTAGIIAKNRMFVDATLGPEANLERGTQ